MVLCEDFSMSSKPYGEDSPIKVATKTPRPEMWACLIASLMVFLSCAGCAGLAARKTGILALQITTGVLPNAQTGSQFQTGMSADGGVQPYHWGIASGTLPSGLSLDADTGVLSGIASQVGQFDFSPQVSDSSSPKPQIVMKALIVVVAALPVIPTGSGVAVTSDATNRHYYTFSFPGYAKYTVADGISTPVAACHSGGDVRVMTQCTGIMGYWDLKNDPNALWDFGADDTGMFEHQWHIQNFGGGDRIPEMKEGPMNTTVTESNNVRIKITQTGKVWPYGEQNSPPQDCCITMTKTYVFYRHGGAGTGQGASKVFTDVTLSYDGTDGLGPVNIFTSTTYNKISYYKAAGETFNAINTQPPCNGGGSNPTMEASPWNIVWNTDSYLLIAPVAKNSSTSGQFLPANVCASPAGSFQGPEGDPGQPAPGTLYNCVGASNSGCTSQTVSNAVIKVNFLQTAQNETCGITVVQHFFGGIRLGCESSVGNQSLAVGSPLSWPSMGWIGDNGITSDSAATPYLTEYRSPPTMTPTNATGGSFDVVNGYWTLVRTVDNVSISANGLLHSPAWLISNWTDPNVSSLSVGGVTKTLNTDYVAVKIDSTHLLIQYLADVPASSAVLLSPAP